MKKQLLLFMMFMLPIVSKAYDAFIGGIYFYLDTETKEAMVKGNPSKYTGNVEIPNSVTYNGIEFNVTSIGDRAFQFCSELTSVSIPDNVTRIGVYAFSGCSGLTSITIPKNMTDIGEGAFYECSGLTSVVIPENMMRIGDSAFYGCI